MLAFHTHPLAAQFIRGTIRAQGSEGVIQGALITVLDSVDKQVVTALSDERGHFTLPLSSGLAFKVTVRKIGWQPSSTDLIHATATDTLDMDLMVPMEGVSLPGVEINGKKNVTFNQRSYDEAKRNGWKIYEPSEIEAHRNEFSNFENMMRALQVRGVKMPAGPNDCYINLRNNRCLHIRSGWTTRRHDVGRQSDRCLFPRDSAGDGVVGAVRRQSSVGSDSHRDAHERGREESLIEDGRRQTADGG